MNSENWIFSSETGCENENDFAFCSKCRIKLRVRRFPKLLDWITIIFDWVSGGAAFFPMARLEAQYMEGEWRRLSRWMDLPVARALLTSNVEQIQNFGIEDWISKCPSKAIRADFEHGNRLSS